jgi:radical SAM protein with 4Fe4S-binding SPASM domain
MSPLPTTCLDLELTRRCNLRCDYCFVGWSRGWSGDMSPETAREIVAQGAGRFAMLHLTGGEPFVWGPLLQLVDQAIDLGYGEVLINTNGTLLDAERIEALGKRRSHVRISVSLDGTEPLHDRARGAGTFQVADRAVAALLAAGVPTTIMSVVTSPVLRQLSSFLGSIFTRHPTLTGVTLFPVGVGATGTQKPGVAQSSLSPDELRELALVVALTDRSVGRVGVGAYPIINPLLLALGYPAARLYQCTAGRGRLCVHSDLGVSSCHPVKEAIYGRWESGLFDRILGHAVHQRLAERDFDGCRTCPKKEACGHCRAFVAASGAPLLGNDLVCREVLDDEPAARTARVHLPLVP